MAGDEKKAAAPASGASKVETALGSDRVTSMTMGEPAVSKKSVATTADVAGDGTSTVRDGLGEHEVRPEDLEDPAEGAEGDGAEGGPEKEPEEGTEEEAGEEKDPNEPEDLGDWEEGKRDQFEARYFTKDGELNDLAIGQEFWSNFAKAENKGDAGLNEATYAYLKDTLGVSKDFCKQVERGLLADQKHRETALYARVGGKESFEAAVLWGKEGGYTPAQRQRFNVALQKGGEDAEEAMDLLMARHKAANPPARSGPPRRQSSPAKPGTASAAPGAGGAAASGDVFKSREEYQATWQAALKKDTDARRSGTVAEKRAAREAVDAIRKKMRRSKFN